MNAVNVVTKAMVCGAVAVMLTAASSWTFVESTARAYWPEDMPTVVVLAKADHGAVRLARNN